MKINKQKLKQIGALFSLLVLSNRDIDTPKLEELLNNVSKTYIEIGNPEYGAFLYNVYNELPDYLKIFLEENLMHIIIMPNNDDIENIYKEIYPEKEKNQRMTGLTIADNLIAFVEGCSHDENINYRMYLKEEYNKDSLNKFDLQITMLHQIGHLIDVYYDYPSKSQHFLMSAYNEGRKNMFMHLNYFYNDKVDLKLNNHEYFALAFATYMLNPIFLKKSLPVTYNYMEEICNKIINKNKYK